VSQNEFVRQAVLGHIVARKADPAYQAAVRHAVKANQRVFERLVVLVRLTKNHALPDGNKRPALATTIACRDGNGFDWRPPAADDSDGEETYQAHARHCRSAGADLEAVEAEVAAWIAERLHQRK
jgi:prophage maintenance system killer protein